MALSGSQFVITAGRHEATIVEVGGGLRRYTADGVDVTVPYGEDVLAPRGSGTALVPWPNRLRGGRYRFDGVKLQLPLTEPAKRNASHGLGRWTRWLASAHEPSSVTMVLDVVPQPGYPFEVRVEVTYALLEEFGLSVTASAHNHGVGRAPFGAGFHPYLATRGHRLDDVTLRLPARDRLVSDESAVPVGEQSVTKTPYDFRRGKRLRTVRLDDGFTGLHLEQGRGTASVLTKSGGAQLWFDATFGYLQVYTADSVADDVPGVAVEPMTCAADAFNSGRGLIIIDPGGTWTGSWGIQPT